MPNFTLGHGMVSDVFVAAFWTFVYLVVVGGLYGYFDRFLRNRTSTQHLVIPTWWLLEVFAYTLLPAIFMGVFFFGFAIVTVGIAFAALGGLYFREALEGRLVINHHPQHPRAGRKRYIYTLRKEKIGVYSLHFKTAAWYTRDSRVSDVSMLTNTNHVLSNACAQLTPGDTLILITGNLKLQKAIGAPVSQFLHTHLPNSHASEYSEIMPPLSGQLVNWRYRWNQPVLKRIKLSGIKIVI